MLYGNASVDRGAVTERHAAAETGASHRSEENETQGIPVLGKTLLFRGELTAEEDVILQGRVEGSIRHARSLIIGTDGSVLGDVYANHLTVEGLVEGDLHCSEAVLVRATAQVRGNIFAPRVGIMEGAVFNGRVEMDANAAAQAGRQGAKPAAGKPAAAPPVNTRPNPVAAARSAATAPSGAGGGAVSGASPLVAAAVDQMLGSAKK
jgi:cytoskeletal protein CcmA (bactofilin family)